MCQMFAGRGTKKTVEDKQTECQPSLSLHFGHAMDWQEQDKNLLGTPLLYAMCQATSQPTRVPSTAGKALLPVWVYQGIIPILAAEQ